MSPYMAPRASSTLAGRIKRICSTPDVRLNRAVKIAPAIRHPPDTTPWYAIGTIGSKDDMASAEHRRGRALVNGSLLRARCVRCEFASVVYDRSVSRVVASAPSERCSRQLPRICEAKGPGMVVVDTVHTWPMHAAPTWITPSHAFHLRFSRIGASVARPRISSRIYSATALAPQNDELKAGRRECTAVATCAQLGDTALGTCAAERGARQVASE